MAPQKYFCFYEDFSKFCPMPSVTSYRPLWIHPKESICIPIWNLGHCAIFGDVANWCFMFNGNFKAECGPKRYIISQSDPSQKHFCCSSGSIKENPADRLLSLFYQSVFQVSYAFFVIDLIVKYLYKLYSCPFCNSLIIIMHTTSSYIRQTYTFYRYMFVIYGKHIPSIMINYKFLRSFVAKDSKFEHTMQKDLRHVISLLNPQISRIRG